jgi:tRNA (guanine37-N1)-methyltransferase
MKIDILTLFPKMFSGPFDESIISRAQKENHVEINVHQLRDWASGRHQTVDDRPFSGGVGMLLMVDPIYQAVTSLNQNKKAKVILTDAGGSRFNQKKAMSLSQEDHLIFICGRYEGVDHRVHEQIADEVLSIGDFVLTGGELPTMIMVDTIVRLIPNVLRKEDATRFESFSDNSTNELFVEYPQYTRPAEYNGWKVPDVLLSGDHKEIEKWKEIQAKKRTLLIENSKQ